MTQKTRSTRKFFPAILISKFFRSVSVPLEVLNIYN